MTKRVLQLILSVCLAAPAATLKLEPAGGALSGTAGSTVGWGFTLTHDGSWIVITSASFCTGTSGVSSACVPASLGTFTDFMTGYGFTAAGPAPDSTSVTRPFSAAGQTGVGSFLIAGSPGQSVSGRLVLTYDQFSRSPSDPEFDPDADTVSTDNVLTADASVTVISETPAVPLPPTLWLTLFGALSLAARHSLRRS